MDADEKKAYSLMYGLLFKDQEPYGNEQLLSVRLAALTYREDALHVWGSTLPRAFTVNSSHTNSGKNM
jgi:hypothetical protein